jgi:hypothetical protein
MSILVSKVHHRCVLLKGARNITLQRSSLGFFFFCWFFLFFFIFVFEYFHSIWSSLICIDQFTTDTLNLGGGEVLLYNQILIIYDFRLRSKSFSPVRIDSIELHQFVVLRICGIWIYRCKISPDTKIKTTITLDKRSLYSISRIVSEEVDTSNEIYPLDHSYMICTLSLSLSLSLSPNIFSIERQCPLASGKSCRT